MDTPSGASVISDGRNSMSIKEAVRVAQSNNFMGLVCSSQILVSADASDRRTKIGLRLINRNRTWYRL